MKTILRETLIRFAKALGVVYVFGGFLYLLFGLCFLDGSNTGESIAIAVTWIALLLSLIANGDKVARWSLGLK